MPGVELTEDQYGQFVPGSIWWHRGSKVEIRRGYVTGTTVAFSVTVLEHDGPHEVPFDTCVGLIDLSPVPPTSKPPVVPPPPKLDIKPTQGSLF